MEKSKLAGIMFIIMGSLLFFWMAIGVVTFGGLPPYWENDCIYYAILIAIGILLLLIKSR